MEDGDDAAAAELVLEWLEHRNLVDTWECLTAERLAQKYGVGPDDATARLASTTPEAKDEERKGAGGEQEDAVQARAKVDEALETFRAGDFDRFFSLWSMFGEHKGQRDSGEPLDLLTFDLHLYAFTASGGESGALEDGAARSALLQAFLNGEGAETARRHPERCSYFALPHVPEPHAQPLFAPLFTTAWRTALRERMETKLRAMCLNRGRMPRLTLLIREQERLQALFREEKEAAVERAAELEDVGYRLVAACVKLLQELARCSGDPAVVQAWKAHVMQLRARLARPKP